MSDDGDAGPLSRGMTRSAPPAALGPLLAQAEASIRRGDLPRAIATLEEILRLAPDHAPALHDLGWSYLATRRFDDAVRRLREAIALRPGFAPSHHGLGLALQELGDEDGAVACFRRAVQLSPKLGEAHARLAGLLVPRGKWEEAAAAYRKAYAAAPGTLEGLLCRARGLLVQERRDEAEARLRELVAAHPGSAEAHLLLANVLSDTGRLVEAAASYEQSLALAPRQATAYGGLVAAKKLTEADRPLLARILARLEANDLPSRHRMTLCFAAGKALDDLNEPAGATAWFDAANAIRKQQAPFDRAGFEQLVDRLIARFTPGFFEEHAALREDAEDDETPVLVLGMPRSGTTLVERFVSSHPSASGGGELVFWNERAPALVDAPEEALVRAAAKTRRDYLALLRGIGPRALRVTDKMPFNFLWIGVVRALFPRARFVHCRRHPVDTCLSIYQTQFAAPLGFASTRGDLAAYYRQYERLMGHWRSVLPAE
ncbi:MAG TPA: sulfotransferase, partial [Polyangiaceae bacterium]